MSRALMLILTAATLTACGGGGGSNDDTPPPSDNPPQSFSVTGTVSGLSSDGLKLAFNGTPVSVASGATTVTLGTSLTSGTGYTVSVQTQPSGQTCSVANGRGTVAAANIANVVVTCSSQAFALGGTISGLDAAGLVLANGADTLEVSANAESFTMPAQIAVGGSYQITVQAQPMGLACAVSNGSGTMPANGVTSVEVNCTGRPFSVGGTISDLGEGVGLILSNGADTLEVSANAESFTMPTAVPSGSSYEIRVLSHPTGLMCEVKDASGVVEAADITSVKVFCGTEAFTLGGTIEGLTQAGLILANGSDTLQVAAGDRAFTMPTSVVSGADYEVRVQMQPTGQSCSVEKGNGTMPAADVSDVAITCDVNTYTIGGSISGLTQAGLVLVNNGGDETKIAANAKKFTMNAPVAHGGRYEITVKKPPATGQVCTVANGSGVADSVDVDTVEIRCEPGFTVSVLHSFGGSDGRAPQTALLQAKDGNFYGTTQYGGTNDCGTVFKMTPSRTVTVLHSFAFTSTRCIVSPSAALIQARDGNFYGTTFHGGKNDDGTLFRVTSGGTFRTLYDFHYQLSGGRPVAALLQASDGNIYGTATKGGVGASGTLFRLTPGGAFDQVSWVFGLLGEGGNPRGIIQGSDGNLYGTTKEGGANGAGAVFKKAPEGLVTVLHHFKANSSNDGATPIDIIQARDGNFYGTTFYGGANGNGTVFKLTPSGAFTVLHSFLELETRHIVQARDGNFYGTTFGGANDKGTVFQVTASGVFTVIHDFGASGDGARPLGGLIEASDGNLYGTTNEGGAKGRGTVFKIVPPIR